MRPRVSADGRRSCLQECELAHVVAQVAQPNPGGCTSLPDASHPRPFHLVDHATEHMFDAYADPGAQAVDLLLMRRQRAMAIALVVDAAAMARTGDLASPSLTLSCVPKSSQKASIPSNFQRIVNY